MNDEQKQLVLDNLNLVLAYINKHHLEKDEYYDLLIVELCNIAISYNKSMGYTFSTYAYKCFDRFMYRYVNQKNAKKNRAEGMLYFDAPFDSDSDADSLYDVVPDLTSPDLTDHVIAMEMLEQIYSCCANKREIQFIKLICMGYSQTEIQKMFHLGSKQIVNNSLRNIRKRYILKYGPYNTRK